MTSKTTQDKKDSSERKKIRFHVRIPGLDLSNTFCLIIGGTTYEYRLSHGEIYTLPQFMIDYVEGFQLIQTYYKADGTEETVYLQKYYCETVLE